CTPFPFSKHGVIFATSTSPSSNAVKPAVTDLSGRDCLNVQRPDSETSVIGMKGTVLSPIKPLGIRAGGLTSAMSEIATSDIPQPLQEPLQRLRRRIALALDLGQRHPVLVPPVLERSDNGLALGGDVALDDGTHVVVQDGQQQLGGLLG